MSFLKAEWRKLVLANYVINPAVLQKHLPAGTELDLWNYKCYVSLVGFMFLNTRLLGVKVPFHVNFEEVNLRFYVKRMEAVEYKRGVVFVKEIVPKAALSLVANTVYNENYETMPMDHIWEESDSKRIVEYSWKKAGKLNRIMVEASLDTSEIAAGSETEFITEHYWGYGRISDSKTNEYEVTHPRWQAYKVDRYEIDVDYAAIYGSEFAFLSNMEPASVMLAEGSEITVEPKRKISKDT